MAYLPPIKLDVHCSWFNLLLTILHKQAKDNLYEEYRTMAENLISKFMSYPRPFLDKNGENCVDLRMYPNEASNVIWLLLIALFDYCEEDKDYSAELKYNEKNKEKGDTLDNEKVQG